MRMRVALALLFGALAATACGNLFDPAAAVVAGNKIPMEEVQRGVDAFEDCPQFEQIAQQQGDPRETKRQFEQGYLSQLIRHAVLEPRAEELGIKVTDSDVAERVEQIKADIGSEKQFERALQQQCISREQLNDLVYGSLVEERLRQKVTEEVGPSETEIREYYEQNKDDFRETRARHILVEELAQARSLVDQLRTASRKGLERLFSRLARRFSTDEGSAARGGDLGYFRRGQFVQPFEETAAQLEVGEISEPIRTQFGYHVIWVTDRRIQPLTAVSEQIAQRLSATAQDEAWQEWLDRAFREADIKVNPRYGEFDIESKRVQDATAEDIPGAETTPGPQASPAQGLPAG